MAPPWARLALAGGAFVVIMGAGIGAGRWLTTSSNRIPAAKPVAVDPVGDAVHLIAVGRLGRDTATRRHVGEAIARTCAARPCDAVLLLGDDVPFPEDAEDPRLADLTTWAEGLGAPAWRTLGEEDQGGTFDPRKARWQLDGTADPRLRSPTWSVTVGDVGVWSLDTTELRAADGAAQAAWLDRTVRASSARWRVALAHDGDHSDLHDFSGDSLCGRFDLVLTASAPDRAWTERCGTAFLRAGTGDSPGEITKTERPVSQDAEPGFWSFSFENQRIRVQRIDADARVTFEAFRHRDGSIRAPGGSVLRPPVAP